MKRKKVRKWLIGAVAYCNDCDWEEEDYKTAQKEARKHALRTGHTVGVETTYYQEYNPKEES